MIDIRYSFPGNTKEMKYLSAKHPRFDFDLATHAFETNVACIRQIPIYTDRGDVIEINPSDLQQLEVWY